MPETNPSVEIFRIQALAIAGSVVMMAFILELIRRRKLQEKYAILWLGAGLVMIVFSIWRDLLQIVATAVGVAYAPALLFLVAMLFGIVVMIHFSVVISGLSEKNKTLAQEIGMLKAELKELKPKK